MTAGYAAFSTNISITTKGNVYSKTNIYVSNAGNDETGKGTKDNPYQTISKAYDFAASEATIYVMDNLTIDESEDTEVNSLLRGQTNQYLLMITAGEVTMTNITFDGQNKEANFNLVSVMYATLNLNEGTTIQNNISSADTGGGIGAYYSTLNIDGAKIINNQARGGNGGGIITNYSNITIEDGEISGNSTTTANGAGIAFHYKNNEYGLLTMNGGTIKNNTTSGSGGGIVVASADMIMNGGEISGNTASNGSGGGIALWKASENDIGSTFTLKNGQIINNTASYRGGGIYFETGSTYSNEGGTVADNIPTDVGTNE